MDDKELDRLFEEAANKYVPPSPPEGAWDKFVETKLTPTEKPRTSWHQSLKKWLAVLLIPKSIWQLVPYSLIVVIALWYAVDQMSSPTVKSDKKTVAIKDNKEPGASGAPANGPLLNPPSKQNPSQDEKVDKEATADRTTINESGQQAPGILSPDRTAGREVAQTITAATANPPSGVPNNKATPALLNPKGPDSILYSNSVARLIHKDMSLINKETVKPSKSMQHTPAYNIPKNNLAKGAGPTRDSISIGINDYLAKVTGIQKPSQISINGRLDNSSNKAAAINNTENQSITKISFGKPNRRQATDNWEDDQRSDRWQLGLLAGTNISTVKGTVSKSLGMNGGVMVQHRINSSRLSVETGLVVASMDYKVANEDFHPGGKDVSDKISNVNGTCTMLDVPVNVRYDLVRSKKSNAFISTGVSAMVMVNQDYNYLYTGQNKVTEVTKDVSGQGNDVYASTNISVGYERRFKKTAIQVAPYVKMPMGSVGYGNLSLGNIGAQISIKKDL